LQAVEHGFEDAVNGIASGYQSAQRAAVNAYQSVLSTLRNAAQLQRQLVQNLQVATQGVQLAASEAVALTHAATEVAQQAVDGAKASLDVVSHTWNAAVNDAKQAINSAIHAVSDFAAKLEQGFFSFTHLFAYASHPHLQSVTRRFQLRSVVQSLSPTQTRAVSSSRKLQSLFSSAFSVVYNGIAGALDFIQHALSQAVSCPVHCDCCGCHNAVSYGWI
jgi:hypothetical protein